MRKLKVYLDTSVISHLLQEDVPEKMADTRQLWEMFKDGKYDVYLSTVTLREIEKCVTIHSRFDGTTNKAEL